MRPQGVPVAVVLAAALCGNEINCVFGARPTQGPTITACPTVALPPAARVALTVGDRFVLLAVQASFDDPLAGQVEVLDVAAKTWRTTNMSSGRVRSSYHRQQQQQQQQQQHSPP